MEKIILYTNDCYEQSRKTCKGRIALKHLLSDPLLILTHCPVAITKYALEDCASLSALVTVVKTLLAWVAPNLETIFLGEEMDVIAL